MIGLTTRSLLLLAALATCVRADDPGLPDGSILVYFPSETSAIIIGSLFALVALALQVRIHLSKPRIWYGLTLSIAAVASAAGWYTRIALRDDMASLLMYIITTLLVILPPASIIAFSYITYGRLILAVDPTCVKAGKRTAKSNYSFIPPRLVTAFFLFSDVSTFVIQAVGGSMQAQTDPDVSSTGNTVFLVGVSLQGASYFLFSILIIFAWFRLRALSPSSFRFFALRTSSNSVVHPVVPIFQTIAATSIFIIIRSVFRIIEMAEGFGGALMASEAYLIVLDAVPMLLTSAIWLIFWPAGTLEEARRVGAPTHSNPNADAPLVDDEDADSDLEARCEGRSRGGSSRVSMQMDQRSDRSYSQRSVPRIAVPGTHSHSLSGSSVGSNSPLKA